MEKQNDFPNLIFWRAFS